MEEHPIPENSSDIKVNPEMTQQEFNDEIIEQIRTFDMYYVSNEAFEPVQEKVEELDPAVKELNQSLTQYEQSGFLSRNLIPSFIVGKYIDGDRGTEMTSNLFSCTDFIKIDATNNYILSNANVNKFISVYDASKTYLGRTEAISNRNIILPSDYMSGFDVSKIAFCRITVQFPNANNNNVMFEEGTEAHSYTPYAMPNTDLTQIVDSAIEDGFIAKTNTFDGICEQGDISNSNGQNASSGASTVIRSVNYISVKPNTEYVITYAHNYSASGGLKLYSYNTSKTFIARIGSNTQDKKVVFKTDSNTYYIRFAIFDGTAISITENLNIYIAEYIPSNTELKQSLSQLTIYSRDEQIIGNYLGKTLYRKVYSIPNDFSVTAGNWANTNIAWGGISTIVNSKLIGKSGSSFTVDAGNLGTTIGIRYFKDLNISASGYDLLVEYTR